MIPSIALPLNWNVTSQVSARNLVGSDSAISISPLIRLQYDSLSIASAISTLTGQEANTYNSIWLGVGAKFDFRHFLGLELMPSFSYALKPNSLSSNTKTTLDHNGWKAELGFTVGGKLFVGTNVLFLNLSGRAQITGLLATGLIGLQL
ncbi:MAG: hypothetical protein ABI041_16065 [Bdellovibrionia bacterium]